MDARSESSNIETGIAVSLDKPRRWRLNGPAVRRWTDVVDVELNFSLSTNLLPIRRLGLTVSKQVDVQAACLRFPALRLEPLEQVYEHVPRDLSLPERGRVHPNE